jgi:predicted membrane protein
MKNDDIKKYQEKAYRQHRHNHIFGGLIFLAAGGLLLAKRLGADIPDWLLSWPMFLITIGLVVSVKSNFKNSGGYIMILVGCAFLLTDVIPNVDMRNFIWPGVLIIIGLTFILRPHVPMKRHDRWRRWESYEHRNRRRRRWEDYEPENYAQPEQEPVMPDVADTSEFVEINAVFGGIKKIVLSKNFRGGEINTFMGGAEINLQQADIKQPVSLEVNNVFGGTKIIIPSNWDIKNEVTAVFGGVEDKRSINLPTPDVSKSIILRGTCVFGGIEIKNF